MRSMWLGQREWSCVHVARDGDSIAEQWCPKGQLPSRAEMLLSRSRWNGPLGGPPQAFPDAHAETVARRSFVRPGMQVLSANEHTAVWLVALRDDVLMGDSWQIQLVHQGETISTTCTVEIWGPVPKTLDPFPVKLVVDLVSAPDGVLETGKLPSPESVEAQIEALWGSFAVEPIESWLKKLERAVEAAESAAPSLAANLCLAKLATRLAAIEGAAFLGLCEESARLHRIVLRRAGREAQPVIWAFSVRGVLLALADLASDAELPALVAACEAAIKKPALNPVERAVLHHCQGELLLRAEDPQCYEAAVTACSRSHDSAVEIGEGGASFLFAAAECIARAYRKLGRKSLEIAALRAALPVADEANRPGLKARLEELGKEDSPEVTEPWAQELMNWHRTEQAALSDRRVGKTLLLSPIRPAAGLFNVLVLRPLLTANSAAVPNRFVNLLQHAWRFRDEPATLTFEETLSRALGHLCSFTSRGGDIEGFGVGRTNSLPSEESQNPESWKKFVEVMVIDPLLSRIVIVYPSDSPGMQWELDLLASHTCAEQVRLFMLPPEVGNDGRERWEAARKVLASRKLKIPDWHSDGLIFAHDAKGEVAWSESFSMLWEGRLAAWVRELAAPR